MRYDFEKLAQGGPTDTTTKDTPTTPKKEPAPTKVVDIMEDPKGPSVDPYTSFELNTLTPANPNSLQMEWVDHVKKHGLDVPFYAVDENGYLWRISPDNVGATVSATPYTLKWITDADKPTKVYQDADAWDQLFADMGYHIDLPPWQKRKDVQASSNYYTQLANAWYVSKELSQCAKWMSNVKPPVYKKANLQYRTDVTDFLIRHAGKSAEELLYDFVERVETGHRYVSETILEDMAYQFGFKEAVDQLEWLSINHPEDAQTKETIISSGKPINLQEIYPQDFEENS